MPKIIIPRDGGQGRSASTAEQGYDAMDLAETLMLKLNKRGVDVRLGLNDPENIILFTGADAITRGQ